jgi:hypothetical protein
MMPSNYPYMLRPAHGRIITTGALHTHRGQQAILADRLASRSVLLHEV